MPHQEENSPLELLFTKLCFFVAIIINFFIIFLYYIFNVCSICSAIPSYVPAIGNLNFLSYYLDQFSWRIITFIDFFQMSNVEIYYLFKTCFLLLYLLFPSSTYFEFNVFFLTLASKVANLH